MKGAHVKHEGVPCIAQAVGMPRTNMIALAVSEYDQDELGMGNRVVQATLRMTPFEARQLAAELIDASQEVERERAQQRRNRR